MIVVRGDHKNCRAPRTQYVRLRNFFAICNNELGASNDDKVSFGFEFVHVKSPYRALCKIPNRVRANYFRKKFVVVSKDLAKKSTIV